MSVRDELASAVGSRGGAANAAVAARCLGEPGLLAEILEGLGSQDAKAAGDCAEVMEKVAEQRPELVAPHAEALWSALGHENGRVRWESAHAFGLVAGLVPGLVARELARIAQGIRSDKSVIVRDHLLDAVANWGATSPRRAREAWPVLREALGAFESKHAARVLSVLVGIVAAAPGLAAEIRASATPFVRHARPGVRKAAERLLRHC